MKISTSLCLLFLACPLVAEEPRLVLLGSLTLTSYQPKPEQTDSSPFITSIGHHVHPFGAAVSPDLLRSGQACYGDVLYVEGYGMRVVNDVMGEYSYRTKPPTKQERWVDLLVMTHEEEKLVNVQRRQVWVMRSPVRACNRSEAINMGMVNAKKIRNAINTFRKQRGKDPTDKELRELMAGQLPPKPAGLPQPYDVHKSDAAKGLGI